MPKNRTNALSVKNSSGSATVVLDNEKTINPSQEAIEACQSGASWSKRWFDSRILRSKFSAEPITYRITISGSYRYCNSSDERITTVHRNYYEEYHPFMAIGRAVSEFYAEHRFCEAHITDIEVERKPISRQSTREE